MPGDPYVEPHLSSAALLTIDTQNDFAEGPYTIAGTAAAASSIAGLARGWRAAGLPIVHIVRFYRDDGSNVDACRRSLIQSGMRLVSPGSSGSQLVSGITPEGADDLDCELLLRGEIQRLGPHEAVIYKPRWSAFFGTPLDPYLLAAGISTLVVTGCNYANCPRATIYDASCRDYRLIVVRDAISGIQGRDVTQLEGIGAVVASSEELLAALPSLKAGARL